MTVNTGDGHDRTQQEARAIRLFPVTVRDTILPEDVTDRDCGDYIADMLSASGVRVENGDVVVISSKVAAFLDGGLVRLEDVVPTRKARVLGWLFHRDPRKVQLVLEQGRVFLVVPMRRIVRIPEMREMLDRRTSDPATMFNGYSVNNAYTFVVKKHATYLDEAGIDHTNSPEGYVTLLPQDPCRLAADIRHGIQHALGADVAVILTDTVTSIGRLGSQDVAIGYAGIDPVTRQTFSQDLFGVPRAGGIDLVIDSIAGMAGLIMGQTVERTPAVVIRGLSYAQERPDELPGMQAVSWPAGSEWKFSVVTVLATLRLWIGGLISLQFRTKTSRRRR